ncbi:phosphohydrolase [Nocardioides marmoriginsengisoli]|uniref:Phosphohydrolase n=1 Tax=Nocardioides marmoriginsengisoli TaxID=661483 RepID=A0A3N0CHB0_9ACTN|nr:phosphosulfolactate synthase [Nocardioides marmoriginsengisoli]RNL62835.1 phosphohydrolase [Nocardioides marmoriginsengisoli]
MHPPSFLAVPGRSAKPRDAGLTHMLDTGLSAAFTRDLLESHADLVDIAKIGWGIAYIDSSAPRRVQAYARAGVPVCLGGTLLEIAAVQNRVDELRAWALEIGVSMIEVSNGLCALDADRKSQLIRTLSADFTVLAEVGCKDDRPPVLATAWAAEMERDLESGAAWVIAEGRESGTVGLYGADGHVREDLIAKLTSRVPVDRMIFEAPRKTQQTWFIRSLGPSVNLGNIAPDDLVALETLRLGLRADTALVGSPIAAR